MQLEAAKEGVILIQNKNPKKRPFTSSIYTRKRELEKLVEGISSFEIAAEGEKYLYETLSNQFVIL
jgi:nicotinic acid mononucleotide adenylyltransferase